MDSDLTKKERLAKAKADLEIARMDLDSAVTAYEANNYAANMTRIEGIIFDLEH